MNNKEAGYKDQERGHCRQKEEEEAGRRLLAKAWGGIENVLGDEIKMATRG